MAGVRVGWYLGSLEIGLRIKFVMLPGLPRGSDTAALSKSLTLKSESLNSARGKAKIPNLINLP